MTSIDVAICLVPGVWSSSAQPRRFKAATGMSVQDYARAARVARAKQGLRTSDRSVNELADALGYTDAASFSAAFRRWTGLSPTDYRARARADRGL